MVEEFQSGIKELHLGFEQCTQGWKSKTKVLNTMCRSKNHWYLVCQIAFFTCSLGITAPDSEQEKKKYLKLYLVELWGYIHTTSAEQGAWVCKQMVYLAPNWSNIWTWQQYEKWSDGAVPITLSTFQSPNLSLRGYSKNQIIKFITKFSERWLTADRPTMRELWVEELEMLEKFNENFNWLCIIL